MILCAASKLCFWGICGLFHRPSQNFGFKDNVCCNHEFTTWSFLISNSVLESFERNLHLKLLAEGTFVFRCLRNRITILFSATVVIIKLENAVSTYWKYSILLLAVYVYLLETRLIIIFLFDKCFRSFILNFRL